MLIEVGVVYTSVFGLHSSFSLFVFSVLVLFLPPVPLLGQPLFRFVVARLPEVSSLFLFVGFSSLHSVLAFLARFFHISKKVDN